MVMTKTEKNDLIATMAGGLSSSVVALAADYRGLTVAQITNLRTLLRECGAEAVVVKNTLGKIAVQKAFVDEAIEEARAEQEQLDSFQNVFVGPTLLITSSVDPAAPAKVLCKFAEEADVLSVKGGWFENRCLSIAEVIELSKLPSKEELQAKLLSILNAPAVQLLRMMKAPSEHFVRLLEAQRVKLEEAA